MEQALSPYFSSFFLLRPPEEVFGLGFKSVFLFLLLLLLLLLRALETDVGLRGLGSFQLS